MNELRVVSVQIRNVLGIEERAIDPKGRAVVVSGENASGKTSLIRAVEATLAGGTLSKLHKVGSEEEPEVVLVLDGPGGHYRVTKRGGDTAEVAARVGQTAAFEDVPRPQEFLSRLFDPAAANPVRFLMADPKDRSRLLLEALDLEMDRAELLRRMGVEEKELPPIPAGLHPLEEMGLIRDAVFRARTGVNRDQKSAAATAEKLRRNTPAVLPEDPAPSIRALDDEAAALARDLSAREAAAKAEHAAAVEKAKTDHDAGAAEVSAEWERKRDAIRGDFKAWEERRRRELEEEISAKRAEVEAEVNLRRLEGDGRLDELDTAHGVDVTKADAALTIANEGLVALRNTLNAKREQLSALRVQAETSAQARALVAQTKEFDDEAEKLKAEGDRLTAALDALDAYARGLADSLPIPGLSIEGKDIRRYGVLYDQLNTQQRVEIAAKVAELRAEGNPLKILFLDNLESLDTKHRTALIEHLVARGLQPFGAVVTDGAPDVSYIGAVQEVA